MASFSFNVSNVSRDPRNGRPGNSIASAAYIAREKLTDERTGKIYDFRDQGGYEYKDLWTPKDAPSWMNDRQRLWQEVENREDLSRRSADARSARRIIAAIPHELDALERKRLVKDFARELTRKGMVVDFAIHKPDAHGDQRNFHVHMLLTTREVAPDGFGNKVREWNDKENVTAWRDRWAELGAKALDRSGHYEEAERYRVANGSLEAQRKSALKRGDHEHAEKLDRKPTRHMGPRASAMEREKGMVTDKGDMNRSIKAKNAQKELAREIARQSQVPGMAGVGQQPHSRRWIDGQKLPKKEQPILHPEFTHAIRKNKARVSAKAQKIGTIGGNIVGLGIESLTKGIESLFNAPMTPAQKQNFAEAQANREQDARDADHERGSRGRD